MSAKFDERLMDWAKWWAEHRVDGGGLEMKVKFLDKAVEGLMELCAHAAHDIREIEARSNSLYTPRSLGFEGDLRKIG